ncbi:MAG TPA: LysR family transcriptional regulator, partial [Xanthobacteraceae bacterium]|nr:LysR family transcriptional regulator [Xanthobacteraceae bacterium]
MIDLRQFRQFVAVAEELSFRRAALRLHMAQPPLTAAIKRIEDELGTTLLERSNRITRLTEAGKVFLEEARRTISQADRAMAAARRAGAGLSGSLRVNFVPSAAHFLMPGILRVFREAYPGIELDLSEATSARQVSALKEERADLGLVMPPLHQAEGLKSDVIVRGQMMV